MAGLYIAADHGLRFGDQIVFTYGPLGFLSQPWLWYPGLGRLAWAFSALLYLALAISLVWALRRSLPAPLAAAVSFVLLVVTPGVQVAVALAAVWCLAALSPDPPPFAAPLLMYGGGILGALESLIQLRVGPVILVMSAIALLCGERRTARIAVLCSCAAVTLVVLWLVIGQSSANVGSFINSSYQIISGYSDAMGLPGSTSWVVPGLLVSGVAVVVLAWWTSARGVARWLALVAIALLTFSLWKEAVVRADQNHTAAMFSTVAVIAAAMWFGTRRLVAVSVVAAATLLAALTVPTGTVFQFSPIAHARIASAQLRLLFNPAQQRADRARARTALSATYGLSRAMLSQLHGHTVQIDPWEAAVAWTYGLDWHPLPVFQEYSAYTSALDRLNADALSSPSGPQRILRENTKLIDPYHIPPAIDSRFPAWDPPERSVALLCNYVQIDADSRWQVLEKVPNRCGRAMLISATPARYREILPVPAVKRGGILFAKIAGADVSSAEKLRATIYRAKTRQVVINGNRTYRLVPGTADDGLILDAAPGTDYAPPFALSPNARTIDPIGTTGPLRISFYWMPLRPLR